MLVLLAAPLALRGDRLVATPLAHVRPPLLARMATPFGPDSLADAAIAQPSLSEAEGWSMSSLFGGGLNSVESVRLAADGASAVVHDSMGVDHSIAVFPDSVPMLLDRFQQAGVPYELAPEPGPSAIDIASLVLMLSPFLVLLLALLALIARADAGLFDAAGGRKGSRLTLEPDTGVSFSDVAGCDGSRRELSELVDFLKDPDKFSAVGARIPRGAIMEGPPGTGKTLLARAVAGEAGVPFVSASGSEFVEMFVGVGAARARQHAPCIVFIDEIDAVGKTRDSSGRPGGGSGEREQTLNQILTEMDGFDGNSGVLVLAATNRADTLDPALLRPGRFDRHIHVGLPDVEGRRAILDVHVKDKPMQTAVDLGLVARRTIGFSGASLANLMNEAAIVAARKDKTEIGYEEIDYAIDRITVGMQKQSRASFPARQRLVACHEAGHAVMGALTPDYDAVTKVTIVPRSSGAGGFTLFTPSDEALETAMYTLAHLKARLAVALGGRVAEEVVYGEDEVTTGARSDLQRVRALARQMVAQWGFAAAALGGGPVAWETEEGNGLLAPRTASPAMEARIDAAVRRLVDEAYEHCHATLTRNRALLDAVTDSLVEKETLGADEIEALRVGHAVAADAGGAAGRANGQRADRMPAPAPWPQPRRRKPVRVRSEGGGPAPGAEYGI
ncbi:ATP-dependent metalloprotease FtsH [Emiliania huxleyi CCMP1516]|uniref:AAA+ ATPase domain-containing protein n=3 Tax=Emiliania huxleyi TaxID=2903 RepID=A0A0D3I0M6_EMIH1|nr:ATP-dependent metalloprotease FtsH [Emiliania huxleyi CCMP1516]EOD04811.1 ATP-dependent metalloprotease FtsH [Emiliania huxleyi CCMP1516]|eukprot:XP_005757240.1 ATP-dependent metalloprotease FtsH [Emiliania huxleyi CCMP1516]